MIFKITLTTLVCIILGFVSLNAQITEEKKSQTLKKGIYKNFEEFKNNNPSIVLDYDIIKIQGETGGIMDRKQASFVRLDVTRDQGKQVGRVYGFCDGNNIYINEFMPKLRPAVLFMKVGFIGSYCFFEHQPFKDLEGVLSHNRLINMQTGKLVTLSKRVLKTLIIEENSLVSYTNFYQPSLFK